MYERIAAVYRDVVGDLPYRDWAAFAHDAWHGDPSPVRTVLDVCCGTGLLTAELIELGYEVTGTDGSPEMIDQARELLGPDVQLSVVVLPDLPRLGRFDAAVSTFDSLNYLTLDGLRATLAAVAAQLRPGGWFVLDLHTEHMMRTIAAAPQSAARSGALDIAMTTQVDLGARTSTTRVRITPDDGPPFVEEHRQYFFAVDQIRAAATDAGLRVVAVTDDYTSEPLDQESLRATWVLRRA